jgi:hypothetical protein
MMCNAGADGILIATRLGLNSVLIQARLPPERSRKVSLTSR